MPPMATTTDAMTRRFAVACGVLSQYVKAAAPMAMPPPSSGAMGAAEPGAAADGAQQLTIFYGGKVVVLNNCTPARASELIRFAASAAQGAPAAPAPATVDMPIARKASLKRFLAKRKGRAAFAEQPPQEEEAPPAAPPAKKSKAEDPSWLALGSLGDMHAQ